MNLFKKKPQRVFLDFASATPVRAEVKKIMRAYEDGHFALNFGSTGVGRTFLTKNVLANPSALYIEARETKEIMQKARAEVASFLNIASERIVFTSGGTESNNIAILGVFEAARKQGIVKPHIISVMTEHPSVREVLDEIKKRGGEVTLLVPNSDGLITPQQVMDAMKENTVLVSVMYVNNEIGVVQPVREIIRAVKSQKSKVESENGKENQYPYFHTDACQAALFYTLDVSTLGVDLLTLDGLKVYGPAGIGCLYVRHGVEISPVMFGGGQENGLRSGTENVSHIIGFAKALSLAKIERKELSERLEKLRDYFIEQILTKFPLNSGNTGVGRPATAGLAKAELNGSRKHRAPNNVNICFSHFAEASRYKQNIHSEYLVVALDTYGVACSYSSSCRTLKEDSSSYVVESLGKPDCALSSIRFTLGRETTKSDVDFALQALEKAVKQVKK